MTASARDVDRHLLACAHAVVTLHLEGQRAWWACDACGVPFSPAGSSAGSVDAAPAPEYLSIRQLAGFLAPAPRTVTLDEMDRAVSDEAATRLRRSDKKKR